MKRFFCALLVITCFVAMNNVFAMEEPIIDFPMIRQTQSEITVQFNGEDIDFTDESGNKVLPQIINDRTMVPMRKIFEEFGTTVEWFGEDRSIKANKNGLEIWLQIDNTTAKVTKDGKTEQIKLDTAPTIVDNRTLVPVRFIAESLDLKVGWDSWNRTVVIIDTNFVEDTLKEKASTFYAFLTDNYQTLESYDINMSLDSNIQYEENKEKETLALQGTGEVKFNQEALSMEGKLKLKGKGKEIEETLSEIPGTIEGSAIIDFKNFVLYFKSPLLNETGYFNLEDLNKWVKLVIEDEEAREEFQKVIEEYKTQTQRLSIKEIIDTALTEDMLYDDTYEELKGVIDIITTICSDEFLSVKENSKGKTYTYSLDKEGLKKIVAQIEYVDYEGYYDLEELTEEIDEELEGLSTFKIQVQIDVQDNVVKSFTGSLEMEQSETISYYWDSETTTYRVAIKGNAQVDLEKYNEEISIKMPAEKDTVSFEDVYVDPFAAMMDQMKFSTLAMGAINMEMKLQSELLRNTEYARNVISNIQGFNYIAQGYEGTLLSESEAEKISCTRICSEFVEEQAGISTSVKTANGEQEVTYYVSSNGKVFFWPPVGVGDACYVNAKTTVKDAKGNDISSLDATKAGTVSFTLENDDKITITTKADGSYTIQDEYTYEEKKEPFEPISKVYEGVKINGYYAYVYEEATDSSKYQFLEAYDEDTFKAQKYTKGWSRITNDEVTGWVKTTKLIYPDEV